MSQEDGRRDSGARENPTGASRARQSGLPEPRRGGMCKTAAPLRRGGGGGSPGRTSVVGLEAQQTWFHFTPADPAVLPLGGGGWICGGFTVLPNLPKPLRVIRDKDRGLRYSTSILRASQKTGHPEPPQEPLTAAAATPAPESAGSLHAPRPL